MKQNKLAQFITKYFIKAQSMGIDVYKHNGELYDYVVTAINEYMCKSGLLDAEFGHIETINIRRIGKEIYLDFTHSDPRILVASLHLNEN